MLGQLWIAGSAAQSNVDGTLNQVGNECELHGQPVQLMLLLGATHLCQFQQSRVRIARPSRSEGGAL